MHLNPDPYFPAGVVYALAAAVLFGASTPFAKMLVGEAEPVLLAGLLYLGSGCGLFAWRRFEAWRTTNKTTEAQLLNRDIPWLGGSILFGGVVGPVLLMIGLATTAASTASLLLNMEGVLTALLAWFVFKENFDRRIALGMVAITAGGVLLSWDGGAEVGIPLGAFAVAGACLAWGIDNNLTRKVSAGDPVQIAAIKGLVAGTVNVGIALIRGAEVPGRSAGRLDGRRLRCCGTRGLWDQPDDVRASIAKSRHGANRSVLLGRSLRRGGDLAGPAQ